MEGKWGWNRCDTQTQYRFSQASINNNSHFNEFNKSFNWTILHKILHRVHLSKHIAIVPLQINWFIIFIIFGVQFCCYCFDMVMQLLLFYTIHTAIRGGDGVKQYNSSHKAILVAKTINLNTVLIYELTRFCANLIKYHIKVAQSSHTHTVVEFSK